MRIIAVLLNLIILGLALFFLAKKGMPSGDDWLLLIPWILAPIINLIAIMLCTKGDNWFSLYFKRKALEEKRKIEQLNSHEN